LISWMALCLCATASLDAQWKQYLEEPPAASAHQAEAIRARADGLAQDLRPNQTLGIVDIVISGGGNFDAYYLGVQQIFDRVQPKTLSLARYAGASAGGMAPFELQLKGENSTLVMHLAYGLLQEQYPLHFSSVVTAAPLQDHLWRLMAHWMVNKWAPSLSTLDGVVHLALSCLSPLPQLIMVQNFTSPDQAEHAFMGTGTFAEMYDGMLCSDGGAESGPKMTPLFQDGLRPQLIVDLMKGKAGYPISMVSLYNTSEYVGLIKKGQDEAVAFLKTGSCPTGAISLCPKGADVSKNVCNTQP